MENIYMLSDIDIVHRISNKIREIRLKQNISQAALSKSAGISLSTLIRMEDGEIKSFNNLIRVLRTLGKLDVFSILMEPEAISPSEYYKLANAVQPKKRIRARNNKRNNKEEETVIW